MSKQPKRNRTRKLNSCHGSWSPKFGASRRKTTSNGVGPVAQGGGGAGSAPPLNPLLISERHNPERAPRRITASTRCRSAAVAKPHQASAAYISLATTTHWKTVCVSSWHMPCARSVLIACTHCAHEPTIFCTWSLTDSLSDMVTPSIFIYYRFESSRFFHTHVI